MAAIPALERIANWTSSLSLAAIPDVVRAVTRICLIDTAGVALAGSTSAAAVHAREVALAVGRPGEARIFGSDFGLAAPAAAFANATAAHALDFDDNCYAGVVHGSAVIVPAALAVAETVNAPGADLVTALVAGAEAEYALGAATGSDFYERGWWTTGVFGPVGAAAATARLLGLDARATASALGMALAGSGTTKACFGTDAKPLLAGRAAEAGVVAALLAARGATGPAGAVEQPHGFARVLNRGVFDDGEIDALGRRWRLLDPGIDVKRIPICLSSHAAVDAVRALAATHRIAAPDVVRVVCDVPAMAAANLAYHHPRNRREAMFSMPFAIATTLLFGDVGLRQLAADVIGDPRIAQLMDKVAMVTGSSWDARRVSRAAPEGASVRIELRDGEVVECFCEAPRGAASRPLAMEEIEAKFRDCASLVYDAKMADDLLSRLGGVEALASVRGLLRGQRKPSISSRGGLS
ncbi:MAG TPA: MmgE/PrpD family protein [Alphaproteobacteria bacterium]|nr:MmgE/PrpD family protein [Alphaproteobacteria bacterium]